MAITDVPAFAHLTDADIESLAVELDAIRQDIEDSRGERDARYIRRTIAAQRTLEVAGRADPGRQLEALGLVGRHRDAGPGQDRREHGDRPQRHARPVGLDERSRDPLLDVGVGHGRGVQALALHPQLHAPQVHQHPRHGRRRRLRHAARHPRPAWKPFNLLNVLCNTMLALGFEWGVGLQHLELGKIFKGRDNRDATQVRVREIRRQGRQAGGQGLRRLPGADVAVAGARRSSPPLTANAVANVIRNVWANAVIFCGHFPDGAEKFTKTDMVGETKGAVVPAPDARQRQLRGRPAAGVHERQPVLSDRAPPLPGPAEQPAGTRSRCGCGQVCDKYDLPYTTGSFLVQYGKTWRTIAKLSLPDQYLTRHRRRRARDAQRADVRRPGARLTGVA